MFVINIIKLIYPNVCGICNNIIDKGYICDNCFEVLSKYPYLCLNIKNIFKHINKTNKEKRIENEDEEKSEKIYYDKLISICKYEGIIRKRIIDFKFKNKKYLYRTFTEYITKVITENVCKNKIDKRKINLENIDMIIPIPMYWKKKFRKGYNHSNLLGKGLSKQFKINISYKLLTKIKDTKPQSSLNRFERKGNVNEVYKITNKKKIIGKVILLVDDVYTTGATANECARILKEAGAKEVIVLTLAYKSI